MTSPTTKIAKLALEDGTVFTGSAFGAVNLPKPITGEVVFNTGMTGYQEVLTDPSYTGQIVTMTYPHVGNYGVNDEDMESTKVQVAGFIVRELSRTASNYRSVRRLEQWLEAQGVLGITGIDTRALTRKLRTDGAMRGVLSCGELDNVKLVEAARQSPQMNGLNLAKIVSPTAPATWSQDLGDWEPIHGQVPTDGRRFRVVAIDCGAKSNILRNLAERGCEVTTVPHDASYLFDCFIDMMRTSQSPTAEQMDAAQRRRNNVALVS